jgi:hypothetical protein
MQVMYKIALVGQRFPQILVTHFAPNFAPSMQSFGGGKFLVKDFLKCRLHFLPQILPLVCKIEIL